ncbi:DUF502 domain-containing protein [Opitutia bacterium ISCC 51]|nr:DUF502 domain-containing protein [Opitutae bacterium ISCC 51]QXD28834.1 DUF502 domain-containing protein [Opitutae bacterium ISCC 52]
MSEKYPFLRSLRNAFLTGLLLLTPLAVSLWVFVWLVNNVGGRVSNNLLYFIPADWRQIDDLQLIWNILATIIVFLAITVLGYLSRYFVGKWILSLAENILNKVPFINTVYKTVKQIVETFSTQQKAVFKKTVLIEYPRKGLWALGFLTSETKGETQAKTNSELRNIFVPTTPNPTSGFLLMIPKEEVHELNMSIGDGMKLIISGGAVVPPYPIEDGEDTTVKIENPSEEKLTEA